MVRAKPFSGNLLFNQHTGEKKRAFIFSDHGNFAAVANAGIEVEGSLVVVSREEFGDHNSMAELLDKELNELRDFEDWLKHVVQLIWGGQAIVGEHGAGTNLALRSNASNSIIRAHRHVTHLGDKVTADDIIKEGEMRPLESWEHFREYADAPYVYLDGYITTKPMGRQYLPRKVTQSHGQEYTLWQDASAEKIEKYHETVNVTEAKMMCYMVNEGYLM